jgi:hypothetical protein
LTCQHPLCRRSRRPWSGASSSGLTGCVYAGVEEASEGRPGGVICPAAPGGESGLTYKMATSTRWRPPSGAFMCAEASHHGSQVMQVGHRVATCERCVCAHRSASPWIAGHPADTAYRTVVAASLCVSDAQFSHATGTYATTGRSPANPYQRLVPGFAAANPFNGFSCAAVFGRSTRADHPGVRIRL